MRGTELLGLFKITALLFFVLTIQTISYCQVYPDAYVDSAIRDGINSIMMQDYYSASRTFTNLNRKYQSLPIGKIYLAAVQIAKAYDFGEEYNSPIIDSLLSSAEDQCKKLLKENKNNIWNEYFHGLAEGYNAYFNALNENWINSFSKGFNALDDFEDVIKKDSGFYDAYIAIGTFKYWRSRKTEFLSWLPGYTDERKEGIRMLEEAAEHNSYNQYLAINSVIWIYIDEKKYKKAAETAESALKKYPGSRFFMWGLGRAYEEISPEKSINIYKAILNSLPANLNHYNEIVLKHLMAQQYQKIGKKQEAVRLCDEILSTKISDNRVYSRIKERLERVIELRRELEL